MSPGALSPQLMLNAYATGIFPMAETATNPELFWLDPEQRAIFPIDQFHISRSMRQFLYRQSITATLNTDFNTVLFQCANRDETWINSTLQKNYKELHALGRCHSLEVWQNGGLLGGLFGITIGGLFCGESMFSHRTNGSKAALAFLTTHLSNCGFALFDTQFITDHLRSLGAVEISRAAYRSQLADAIALPVSIISQPIPNVQNVLQRNTHTS